MEDIMHKIRVTNCFEDLVDIVDCQQELLIEIADGQGLAIDPSTDLKLTALGKTIKKIKQDLGIRMKDEQPQKNNPNRV